MTTTTPANLPALVRRQWDREPDAMHPLVWAEWLEEKGHTDRGELVRLEFECRDPGCDCVACRRVRELRAKLSAWPCPECGGNGIEKRFCDDTQDTYDGGCPACDGSGEVLSRSVSDPHWRWVNESLPLTWDCGFPRWVTLPTIEDAVREVTVFSFSPDALAGADATMTNYLPTPRLRALAAVPPWGVPLDGVRVGDREPHEWETRVPDGCGGGKYVGLWSWLNADRPYPSPDRPESANLPAVIFAELKDWMVPESGWNGFRKYPTEQAAADALARGLVAFARGYE
jgi:uncharacterized protein (TIGR02996 family)